MRFGELAALGAAFCWTINGLFIESAGKVMGGSTVNFLRLVFGLCFLCVYNFFVRGLILPTDAGLRASVLLFISGVIGFFVGDFFLIKSMMLVGPRISMLMMSLSPPFTAVLDFLMFGTVISVSGLLGMAVTLSGVGIVVAGKRAGSSYRSDLDLGRGVLYGALGAAGQAGGLMFSKLGMGDYNAFAATQLRVISAILLFLLFMIFRWDFSIIKSGIVNYRDLWKVVLAGATGPFIGVGLSLIAIQNAEAGVASTLTSVMPVIVIPFSVFINKERISVKEIFGAVLSVVGIGMLFIL